MRTVTRRLRVESLEQRALLAAVSVIPSVETVKASAADDVAVWIHATDTAKSTIIGTSKNSSSALRVYDLEGNQIQSVVSGKVNNVDLRYNFPLGSEDVAILIGSNRSNDSIAIFAIDSDTGLLQNAASRTISTGMNVYGAAMYVSPVTGDYFAFVTSESGDVQQWKLFDDGAGKVDAELVRSFDVGGQSEGIVADDVAGVLYVAEENRGIWRYSAEADGGSTRTLVDSTGAGNLDADVEGLTIYYAGAQGGYLLASSQGSDEFAVYRRDAGNSYVGNFEIIAANGIDVVSNTDGIDVTNVALGTAFPEGMFVAQDNDANFKLVQWNAIAAAFPEPLTIDTSWDPRLVGGSTTNRPPQVNAGADQSVLLGATVTLNATVTDDGRPDTPGEVSTTWTVQSGPGTVVFADAAAVDTTATFSAVGTYVLRLSASDGSLTATDEVTVEVSEQPLTQTVSFQDGVSGYTGTRDTMIRSKKLNGASGLSKSLDVDGSPDTAILISWDVRSVAVGSTVQSAEITLNVTGKSKNSYPVYAVKKAWSETDATWLRANQSTTWTMPGAQDATDFDIVPIGTLNGTVKGLATITLNAEGLELVQSWIDDPSTNLGIIIQNYSTATDELTISSREAKNASTRPKLTITTGSSNAATADSEALAIATGLEVTRKKI